MLAALVSSLECRSVKPAYARHAVRCRRNRRIEQQGRCFGWPDGLWTEALVASESRASSGARRSGLGSSRRRRSRAERTHARSGPGARCATGNPGGPEKTQGMPVQIASQSSPRPRQLRAGPLGCEGVSRKSRAQHGAGDECSRRPKTPLSQAAFGFDKRRGWDLNPRAPVTALAVFKTAPFDRSGTPPWFETSSRCGRGPRTPAAPPEPPLGSSPALRAPSDP